MKSPPLSQEAHLEAGYLLRWLQQGVTLSMPQSRPMPSIGSRCHERLNDDNSTWRIVRLFTAGTVLPMLAVFVPMILVFSVGCSDNSNNDGQVEVGSKSSTGNFVFPQAIQEAALPDTGTVHAYMSVDGSPREEMTVSTDKTQATINWPQSLSIGDHSFKIEFEFESSGYLRPLPLVDGTITQSLVAGLNNVSFTQGDYNDPPDTDGDGKNNLDEVVDSDNPFSCVVGVSHLGGCQL